jgi:predicted PurR-regulated permease PerM
VNLFAHPPRHERLPSDRPRPAVHPWVAVGAAYAWRLLAIGLFLAGVAWLAGQLLVVLVPVGAAALLTRALAPVASWLRTRGLKPGLAAVATVLGFVVVVVASVGALGWAVADDLDEVRPTLDTAVDDIAVWLVEDSPFDVTRGDVDRWRAEAGDSLERFTSSDGGAISGVVLFGEVVLGILLTLVVTFFLLKDGRRFAEGAVRLAPVGHRATARRAIDRGWEAAGGYLRGAAVLGVVESLVIGLTLVLVGAELVAAVMLITFAAAFVPIVGAIGAGVVAVLVALVTAGTVPALITAGVALVVQQVDNDLLAPWIYGRAVRLHPLVVLLGIAAGGALFGIVGAVFAVPFLAVTLNALAEVRRDQADDGPALPWFLRVGRPRRGRDAHDPAMPRSAVAEQRGGQHGSLRGLRE